MSKIFFISSNLFTEPYPVYPLGMAVVASALAARGHKVRQFDLIVEDKSEDRLQKAITEFSPDYIAISIRNMDNVDSLTPESAWSLSRDRHLVNHIRQITTAPIILGGPAFSVLPEKILDYIKADYGITGEGERLFCDLIDTGKEYRLCAEIPGIPKDKIDINVDGDSIEISAEAQTESEEEKKGYVGRERTYSKFYRSMNFPEQVIPEKAQATLENGILDIIVPKRVPTEAKKRKVKIK